MAKDKTKDSCPNCGYCPHCGQSPRPPVTPAPYPVPVPYRPRPRPYPYWGTPEGTIKGNQSISVSYGGSAC